ncbi:hypothetical protein CROQUDRAFT_662360 [Cronartium quercuum f. sp. fusiforme G11]|uniref:Uncharacterized protein n=1 Tax=Cronartium quercuum f. sp. fusiforme G11 TaxID=708437 RepID=A0A9P6T9I7_9BASI|nr:hypothetical protein CROQUDRAFT_662360 [Cronartium quercuum f. sp. fusiforme G11]
MFFESPSDIALPPSPAQTNFCEPPEDLVPIPLPDSAYWSFCPSLDPNSLASTNFPSLLASIQAIMSTNTEVTKSTGSSIKPLEQDNFHQWKGSMLSYFLEHNLDGIIDGSETKPEATKPVELANWLLREKKAAGFIARKLDSHNRDLIVNDSNRKDPMALWDLIILELFTRFLLLNCTDGNLDRYVTSFCQITKEMSDTGVNLDDDLLAHMVLHHLPDKHKTT